MLYLTRREGEAVIVDNGIEVRVVAVRGRTVRLGFRFPAGTSVLREELFEQIRRANEEAATTGLSLAGAMAGEASSDHGPADEERKEQR